LLGDERGAFQPAECSRSRECAKVKGPVESAVTRSREGKKSHERHGATPLLCADVFACARKNRRGLRSPGFDWVRVGRAGSAGRQVELSGPISSSQVERCRWLNTSKLRRSGGAVLGSIARDSSREVAKRSARLRPREKKSPPRGGAARPEGAGSLPSSRASVFGVRLHLVRGANGPEGRGFGSQIPSRDRRLGACARSRERLASAGRRSASGGFEDSEVELVRL